MKNLINKVVELLKRDIRDKNNSIIKQDEYAISMLERKERPKGIIRSIIANYKNKDSTLFETFWGFLGASTPTVFILLCGGLCLSLFDSHLMFLSVMLSIFSFLFFGILVWASSGIVKIEYSEPKAAKLLNKILSNHNESNKIVKKSCNKIDNLFNGNEVFEKDWVIELNGEKFNILDRAISSELLDTIKETLSKNEIIDLISKNRENKITYMNIIDFINESENKSGIEDKYNAMFGKNDVKNVSKVKMNKKIETEIGEKQLVC